MEKAEDKIKEAYGALKGDGTRKAEQAERERARQRRKGGGNLVGITGTLTGL